jgi:ATP-binding cassette subfamily B protein
MTGMPGAGFRGGRFYGETDEKPKITKELILRIINYFKPYRKLVLVMLLAIIATSVLGIVPSVLTKNIIDTALPKEDFKLLLLLIVMIFAAQIVNGLIDVGQSYLNTLISKNIIRDLRSGMYRHLQGMSLKFFSDVKAGEIASRINNDIGGIESIFSITFIQIIQGVFVFSTTAVSLFYTNWVLAIVSMLILPLFLAPTRKVGKSRWQIASQTQAKLAELTTIISETLNVSGTMLIKLFTREKDKCREFDKVNDEVTSLGIRERVVGRWFIMSLQTFSSLGPMLIYLFGGLILIKYHTITVGGVVMFVSLIGRLYGPVNVFANIHVDIVRSMALFERIFQYFDLKSEITEKKDAIAKEHIKGRITFDNVSFSYNEKSTALRNIDFTIEPGQTAAFVGPSGAGKTTITYLVPRLYDVTSGAVRIDDADVRDMTLDSLRAQIGMVTQDTFLYNASIRENLLFARGGATEADIIQACKMANIHDFIASLPDGYDSVVGDRGIKLSGGEKQRISIARTLLKNPAIVIFDEATSALDSNSEALVQQAIEPLLKARTSLVIAHRLSTIMSADIIFVVQNGRIAECGKHTELIQKDGVYKKLYDAQFKSA